MTTNGISTASSKASTPVPYTDHSNDYIPQTTQWNQVNICDLVPQERLEEKKSCCSSVKTLDRAINKAYSNGVQAHLGIKAIQDYPCVTEGEMSRLSNNLRKAIKSHGIKISSPAGLKTEKRPVSVKSKTLRYCKEVVFEKLARELDRAASSKPIAFGSDILRYCQTALTLRPGSVDPSKFSRSAWGK